MDRERIAKALRTFRYVGRRENLPAHHGRENVVPTAPVLSRDNSQSANFQNSLDLGHEMIEVSYVFDNLVGMDDIHLIAWEGEATVEVCDRYLNSTPLGLFCITGNYLDAVNLGAAAH